MQGRDVRACSLYRLRVSASSFIVAVAVGRRSKILIEDRDSGGALLPVIISTVRDPILLRAETLASVQPDADRKITRWDNKDKAFEVSLSPEAKVVQRVG